MSIRYIRHTNRPPCSDDLSNAHQNILSTLQTEARHVQNQRAKSRTGSVYVGITGAAMMAHHLSTHPLPGLAPADLLTFADARLADALNLSPTSLSSPKSGSHSSFLETAVGIATLILIRAMESASTAELENGVVTNITCLGDSWTACAQLVRSATKLVASEDRWRDADDDSGCEVLYGRAGLLYALLRLRDASRRATNAKFNASESDLETTVSALSSDDTILLLVQSIIRRGEAGAAAYAAELAGRIPAPPPLMWSWYGKRYIGAAHGVAGILHILLLCPAHIIRPYMGSILRTVEWLIGCQDAHGNWPSAAPRLSDYDGTTSSGKELVQWCHGASGVLLLLCTVLRCATPASPAALLEKVITSVQAAAALVYRHGLLAKGIGLCHGVAGSVFALIAVSDVLDRARSADNNKIKGVISNGAPRGDGGSYYLVRAVHLAQLAAGHKSLITRGEMRVPDHPWSLYEGLAGMCCAWAEVLRRLGAEEGRQFERSGMPGFDDVEGDSWASW
ncbi:hypothetical protein B0H17DRAFT_1096391 [Mycena rosella]|uniref:Lanthionine synthetase C family protein n=1 Tax=Mycena rosella TaxID=1033263 RepID=A0AAD7CQZ8_MYCRO|nr:hypothetical protein B0H17DRAFT_1096391 [Mycena rosella]